MLEHAHAYMSTCVLPDGEDISLEGSKLSDDLANLQLKLSSCVGATRSEAWRLEAGVVGLVIQSCEQVQHIGRRNADAPCRKDVRSRQDADT